MRRILLVLSLQLAAAASASATDLREVDRTIKDYAAKEGITDPQSVEELTANVRAIVLTRERFAYENVKGPCAKELGRLCKSETRFIEANACLKRQRDAVSETCELALRKEFGGKPLAKPTLHNGVLIPAGSHFFYDYDGRIIGAITTGPVTVNGMQFQAGQIRWHPNRTFWTGSLVGEQVIHGIKFKSTEIGIFFHPNGRVENSILAEDTVIDGVAYKGGAQILFHPSGKVSIGELADTGELVTYNPDGSRQSISRPQPPPPPLVLVESSATKPICPPGTVPTVECLPQRFANLPPDPGERGKQTLKGIDSDGDGLRDDVQRFIVLNWGHSERAVRALSSIARNVQQNIELGSTLSRDEAYEIAKGQGKPIGCFSRSVDDQIRYSVALEKVVSAVANTPDRKRRYHDFDSLLSGRIFVLDEGTTPELCGYDPAALPN